MKKFLKVFLMTGLLAALLCGCGAATGKEEAEIRILATSDIHGKMVPWDYALNAESPSGSMAQLATAVNEFRTEDCLLIDAGDIIQGNSTELFMDEEVHPMIAAMNAMDYDVWVTGNHEYNYGLDNLKKAIAHQNAKVLTGNVKDPEGNPLADGYTVIEKDGVKIGIIGMVTPNITRWDAANLAGCEVSDPVVETRTIIDEIGDDADVLIGVMHMDVDNECNVEDSGVNDLANACPELDLIIAAHGHMLIDGEKINGVPVVENMGFAQTLAVIDLFLKKTESGWDVTDIKTKSIEVADYKADDGITKLLAPYDEQAKANAEITIGQLKNGDLAPESGNEGLPAAQTEDTALIDLINNVQLYYSGADVSTTALLVRNANLKEGIIRRCDTSLIYKYDNTLYILKMTGAQLRKYMEWSARYFNTYTPGDSAISADQDIPLYDYDMFEGVNYKINIAKEPGERIEDLTWPDGTPVKDSDEFTIVVNNYRANSLLLAPGLIFAEDDLPVLMEKDVRDEIGGIRELIGDYIINVKGGVIEPEVDHNWSITGWSADYENIY